MVCSFRFLGKRRLDLWSPRAAEPVDALRIIAYGHHIAVHAGEELHEFRLEAVGVLVFVYQEVLATGGYLPAGRIILLQEV